MGELSIIQVVMVLVIALLVFGPDRMPEMGRQLGRGLRELRRHASSVTDDLSRATDSLEDRPPPSPQATPDGDPPATGRVPDDATLLDGVVVTGETTPPAAQPPADAGSDADLLDGVVVSGDTPPRDVPA